jgi:hypothetical protein
MNTPILFVRPASIPFAAIACLSLSITLASAQTNQSIFPLLPASVSTVPSNGDVNPYGGAFGPKTLPAGGGLQPGDILVSNFNNSQNLQGTGATIVRVTSAGQVSTFYTGSTSQSGLTAALGILTNGFVLIGNVPTADGTRPPFASSVCRGLRGDALHPGGTRAA